MIVIDVETDNKANLILIGTMNNGRYKPFYNAATFWKYVKRSGITQIYAHNLEYDFFKLYEYLPFLKFCCYYSSAGLSYVQVGNIFLKETYNHLAYSLKNIGKIKKIKKIEPKYDKITKLTPYVQKCNKNHCRITYEIVKLLASVYRTEGSQRVKSTVGSQALEIYTKRFKCCNLLKLNEVVINHWRKGYKGGWCECFKKGAYGHTTFYKIDINSLYPFVMRYSYPYPYTFKVKKELTEHERTTKFWLGVNDETCINSIEHRNETADFYYVFTKRIYPFKLYIDYFYDKKRKAAGLKREIYKKLLNSLYGKFGQRCEVDVVSNYNYKKQEHIFYQEQIIGDLYRIKFDAGGKFWVNVIWSLFTTARARFYMVRMKEYIERQGLTVYYTDTDSFIVSGDMKRISSIISEDRIGLFKLEAETDLIDIRGKKFYRFGSVYKCKGVPAKYRKKFFKTGKVTFKKMVRYKEALMRNLRVGTFIDYKKSNIKNK